MSYQIKIVTPPDKEPVELSDVRRHIKASTQDDNETISGIIATAREYVEANTGLCLIQREMQWLLDRWGKHDNMPWWDGIKEGIMTDFQVPLIKIPYGPLVSITHIKTYDDADVATTWPTTEYMVDTSGQLGRLRPRLGSSWPQHFRVMNGIEIQFIAGYGESPKDCPALAKLAIMMQCSHLYQHRGDLIIDAKVEEAPRGVMDLIDKLKLKSFS